MESGVDFSQFHLKVGKKNAAIFSQKCSEDIPQMWVGPRVRTSLCEKMNECVCVFVCVCVCVCVFSACEQLSAEDFASVDLN